MRKITFYLMLLFCASAFSQVEISENFDTSGLPENWTAENSSVHSRFRCSDTGSSLASLAAKETANTITMPIFPSNGTALTVSFNYNIYENKGSTFFPNIVAPPTAWGTLVLEYTTDAGETWTNLTTVNDSSFTYEDATTCATFSTSIDAGVIADESNFQARFVFTNASESSLFCILDEISLNQESTTVPNCTTITAPENEATNIEVAPSTTISWNKAIGFASGYKLSVGTTADGTDVLDAVETTETSYDVTGLDYETMYYVTVTPYNDFGDATDCTGISFTTRNAPIQGATCDNPFEVTLGDTPYVHSSNTANFENLYSSNPCTTFSGNDVIYKIEPTEDVAIDLSLVKNNPEDKGAVLAVLNDCPGAATECLGSDYDYGADNRELTDILLYGNNTYYVVVSSKSASSTFGYNLVITKKDCIAPHVSVTPVADCDNAQFNVDVDVTYTGDATTLTLTDDQGNSKTDISETGIVTMGPYASGTTVNFTLANDGTECNTQTSTFYYCPPANDNCDSATALEINTDQTCTLITSATNAGATHSEATGTACGTSGTNDVWFSFVAVSEGLVLEYSNITAAIGEGGTIQATEILEGTCDGEFTSLLCTTGAYVPVSGLTIGNTYYIRNYTNLGGEYAQNYDICLKTPPAPPANDDCVNAIALTASTDDTCDNKTNGSTIGATRSAESQCEDTSYAKYTDVWYTFNPETTGLYEFNLTKNSGPSTNYFIYSGTCGELTAISTNCNQTSNILLSLDSETTYYVAVRSSTTEPGSDFDLCVWNIEGAAANNSCISAIAMEESLNDEGNNAITGTLENAYPSAENCNTSRFALWYSFTPKYTGNYYLNFSTDAEDPADQTANFSIFSGTCGDLQQNIAGLTSCWQSGEKTAALEAGTTYYISIHDTAKTTGFTFFAYPDASLSIENVENTAEFKYYPNPIVNDFTIEAKSNISKISVFNMLGQEVAQLQPKSLKATLSMTDLQNGVYFVKVDINNATKTIKVIKK
ncbi:T9SS type A sorting domain-containing protein [Formosa sp. A9]|uniref:T9SS type A sorting domain-containing protein n=1 Tax=Formosa sp. A9 TaxID=3442641 RepID=UPI003EBCEA13